MILDHRRFDGLAKPFDGFDLIAKDLDRRRNPLFGDHLKLPAQPELKIALGQ